jgi:hypothetical protein
MKGMAKLTPAGAIGKWVLAPIALILIGYYLIGPRIGKTAVKPPKSQADTSTVAPTPSGTETDTRPTAPDVNVTVQRADDTPRRRRHRVAKPDQKPEVAEAPKPLHTADQGTTPPDEGGSAGSTTAGGQT